MKDDYALQLLTRFLYHEVTGQQVVFLTNLLHDNPELRATYLSLREAKLSIPKDHFNPSAAALRRVMEYSAETALEQV